LVITGDHDFIPVEIAEHIAQAVRGATLVTIRGLRAFRVPRVPRRRPPRDRRVLRPRAVDLEASLAVSRKAARAVGRLGDPRDHVRQRRHILDVQGPAACQRSTRERS